MASAERRNVVVVDDDDDVVLDSGLFLTVKVYLKAKELLFAGFFYILEADKIIQMNICTDTFKYAKLYTSRLMALLRLWGSKQLLGFHI